MNLLRELTSDEIARVCGAGGTAYVQSVTHPDPGTWEYTMTCGSGYSISPKFNVNATQQTSYASSSSAWNCAGGQGGMKDYTFLSDGTQATSFESYTWHGE